MGRKILAVVVAWIAAGAIILIGQMFMASFWPAPSPAVREDAGLMRAYIETLPTAAFVTLAVIYAVASFVGGFVATKMGRRWSPGPTLALIIGVLLFIGGILNFFVVLPYHPTWVTILCLLIYIPFAWLGYKVAR
jgi:MFS family permease